MLVLDCYSSQRQPYFLFLKVPSGILEEPIEKANKALSIGNNDRLLAVMFTPVFRSYKAIRL
jgi:hypothetical protein